MEKEKVDLTVKRESLQLDVATNAITKKVIAAADKVVTAMVKAAVTAAVVETVVATAAVTAVAVEIKA